MPINPDKRHLYPTDWKEISLRVRARADWRCECTGQCGAPHPRGRCNAPNGTLIIRDVDRPWRWRIAPLIDAPPEDYYDRHGEKVIRVVLTVAHLDHDPTNNDEATNLLAMCQRCHLVNDLAEHKRNARRTRDRKSGQTSLAEIVAEFERAGGGK